MRSLVLGRYALGYMAALGCVAGLGVAGWGCIAWRMPREAEMPAGDADPHREAAYQGLLERHTAEQTLLDGFNTRAVVAATLEQPAFAKARIERTGHLRAWPEEKIEAAWAEEQARMAGVTEFFVGLQAASRKHDELDVRDSIWQLSLRVDGAVYFPTAIRRVGRSTLDMRTFYPYMGLAWTGYRVQFPVVLKPPFRASLVVASSLGKAEFFYSTWQGPMQARSR